MKGLRRRIEAIIEEVNHEIRVDLGLVQPTAKERQETIEQAFDFFQEEDESPEAMLFERVPDEIECKCRTKCDSPEKRENSGELLKLIIDNL
jgi:hypothetical protein